METGSSSLHLFEKIFSRFLDFGLDLEGSGLTRKNLYSIELRDGLEKNQAFVLSLIREMMKEDLEKALAFTAGEMLFSSGTKQVLAFNVWKNILEKLGEQRSLEEAKNFLSTQQNKMSPFLEAGIRQFLEFQMLSPAAKVLLDFMNKAVIYDDERDLTVCTSVLQVVPRCDLDFIVDQSLVTIFGQLDKMTGPEDRQGRRGSHGIMLAYLDCLFQRMTRVAPETSLNSMVYMRRKLDEVAGDSGPGRLFVQAVEKLMVKHGGGNIRPATFPRRRAGANVVRFAKPPGSCVPGSLSS